MEDPIHEEINRVSCEAISRELTEQEQLNFTKSLCVPGYVESVPEGSWIDRNYRFLMLLGMGLELLLLGVLVAVEVMK